MGVFLKLKKFHLSQTKNEKNGNCDLFKTFLDYNVLIGGD